MKVLAVLLFPLALGAFGCGKRGRPGDQALVATWNNEVIEMKNRRLFERLDFSYLGRPLLGIGTLENRWHQSLQEAVIIGRLSVLRIEEHFENLYDGEIEPEKIETWLDTAAPVYLHPDPANPRIVHVALDQGDASAVTAKETSITVKSHSKEFCAYAHLKNYIRSNIGVPDQNITCDENEICQVMALNGGDPFYGRGPLEKILKGFPGSSCLRTSKIYARSETRMNSLKTKTARIRLTDSYRLEGSAFLQFEF